MLVVGLTGGIGSGKSEASRMFEQLGVPVIDTDVISRELVEPGQPALGEITACFGAAMLDGNGHLRRDALRRRVFADADARAVLQRILHPRIRDRVAERLQHVDAPYVIVVVPLLVESGQSYDVDRVLVIDSSPAEQVARASHRDNVEEQQIEAIISTQAPRQQRLAMANDVIDNSGTLADLRDAVASLHANYLRLAAQ